MFLGFKFIFEIFPPGESVSSILNETVPAVSEDFYSKAEYKDKDGQELHAASKTGCIEIIELLLSQGFDIDSRDRNGFTPLMWTALNGQQDAFQMLLQKGANRSLKNGGRSLLHFAAEGGNTSIINELLSLGLEIDSGCKYGGTPLMTAAGCDKQNAFQILIQNGADPSLKNNGGYSLLHFAAEGGNTSIINELLSRGLDVESRSNDRVTPLMTAAIFGNQNAFQILIEKGADPFLKDNCGYSLLHKAAEGGNTSIIKELLSLGLDVHLKGVDGVTSLARAIENSNSDAVKFLISKGALK